MVSLTELLKNVTVENQLGPRDTSINGIAYDSRRVRPGFLFVAVEGFKVDGHDFIPMAIEKGAVAVVVQREINVPAGIALVVTQNSREALALMGANFYGNPSHRLTMVGVTGTNGKTTITHLIEEVLTAAGKKVGLLGTIQNRLGREALPGDRTTPESLDLQQMLSFMLEKGASHAVMEVSSHALDLHRVTGCEFDYAVFTNLTQDHLDFHHDMDSYREAKIKLFTGLGSGDTRPPLGIINIDDPSGGEFVARCKGKVVTYAVKQNTADYWAKDINVTGSGLSFIAVSPQGELPLKLKLTGLFNVYNTLAALAVCHLDGVPLQVIGEALERVGGVAGRFETVNAGQPFTVVVDYAHTPDSLENVLKTAREVIKGKIISVFGCGGDRDKTKRPLMGEVSARLSDYTIITSDNPRTEDPEAIIEQVAAGVRGVAGDTRYKIIADRRKAIAVALKIAQPGDLVMIAGKGHETYQIVGDKVLPFDDREVAKDLLQKG